MSSPVWEGRIQGFLGRRWVPQRSEQHSGCACGLMLLQCGVWAGMDGWTRIRVTFLAIRSPILTTGSPVVLERVWLAALRALLIIFRESHCPAVNRLSYKAGSLWAPLRPVIQTAYVKRVFAHIQNLRKSGEGLELFLLGRRERRHTPPF